MPQPPTQPSRHAVRGGQRDARIGTLVGRLTRGWCATLGVDLEDHAGLTTPGRFPRPVILALWHDSIFAVPALWSRVVRPPRDVVVLTSASKDGAVLESAMAVFGFGAVRGSSSRRAVAALIGLRQAIRAGRDATITPDGPRGPRHRCQPGIIKLAQSTGAPIIPIRIQCAAMFQLATWDRFIVPTPFSRVRLVFDTPVHVPADACEDTLESARARLERALTPSA